MRSRPPSGGFTLVELLLVITIIGVLAAVMVPLNRRVKARAGLTVSSANLRSLVTANWAYASDHGGRFCPAQSRNNRVRWHGARASRKEKFDPTKGYLSPYLGESQRVGVCPVLKSMLAAGGASFEEGTGGYGYNAAYIGGTPEDPYQASRTSAIPNPLRTVMFASTALAREESLQEYPYAEPYQWVDPNWKLSGPLQPSVHFRFGGKALIAWADGHVTLEEPSRLDGPNYYGGDNAEQLVGWFGPEDENGFWNPRRE
jgi:prepilin-type N-terminal cleavage/methylation domain-containing protein/prepilin-type processing-associated H-X9-DG protein